jgi:hypothetical protein
MFKTIAVPALLAGFLLSVSSARAQEVRFDDIDGDADGLLTRTELAAVFGSRGGVILGNDRNGDGERRDDDRSGRLGGSDERDDGSDDDGDDGRDDGRGDDRNDDDRDSGRDDDRDDDDDDDD